MLEIFVFCLKCQRTTPFFSLPKRAFLSATKKLRFQRSLILQLRFMGSGVVNANFFLKIVEEAFCPVDVSLEDLQGLCILVQLWLKPSREENNNDNRYNDILFSKSNPE